MKSLSSCIGFQISKSANSTSVEIVLEVTTHGKLRTKEQQRKTTSAPNEWIEVMEERLRNERDDAVISRKFKYL